MIVKKIKIEKSTRILNGSLPDIDLDFQSDRRNEVKKYLENKYGEDSVCSVGTYGTYKLKAAFQDIGRIHNVGSQTRNFLSKVLEDSSTITDLFKTAIENQELRELIQRKPEIVEDIQLILNQAKNSSVHACATIVTPQFDRFGRNIDIYNSFPVKMMGDKNGDELLVSEWEGQDLETAGYLKADILGIAQLEKFAKIQKLIRKNSNKDFNIDDIPLDDAKTYELFSSGNNFDVFQFGSSGLKAYCQDVKPYCIDDLIAVAALYRPSSMIAEAHTDFVKIRNGEMEPEYDWGCEEITKDTYGLQIYQETQMRIVQELGGFSLEESDKVRKAIGKKKVDLMVKYRDQFVDGAISKGCPEYEAEAIWDKIAAGAEYSFNKSHSACYAITGYYCNWLKANYPKEFWTVALGEAKAKMLPGGIAELKNLDNGIEIVPPDINKSGFGFTPDFETGEIFWSIDSIKFLGKAALDNILDDKSRNGKYFSFEEFLDRLSNNIGEDGEIIPTKVNKRCVENLIMSGAFDKIEKIKNVKDRISLIKKYFSYRKEDLPDDYSSKAVLNNHFWALRQKDICGYGDIDIKSLSSIHPKSNTYISPDKFFTSKTTEKRSVLIGGMLSFCAIKKTKNGDPYARIEIENNSEIIKVMMWSDSLEGNEQLLKDSIGRIIFINGKASFNDYDKKNNLMTIPSSEFVFVE